MRVRQDHVGHVGRREAMRRKPLRDEPPHAEIAGIDQDHAALASHQRDRAPAKPAMADGLARIALHQDVDGKSADTDGRLTSRCVHALLLTPT